jgi:hypothetical protein
MCLADVFGITEGGARDRYGHIFLWLIFLVITAPGLWFLLRVVRDPWWQPWRKPETLPTSAGYPVGTRASSKATAIGRSRASATEAAQPRAVSTKAKIIGFVLVIVVLLRVALMIFS